MKKTNSSHAIKRARVLEYIKRHPGAILDEISSGTGMKAHSASGRISELKAEGLIYEGGRRQAASVTRSRTQACWFYEKSINRQVVRKREIRIGAVKRMVTRIAKDFPELSAYAILHLTSK